MSSTTPLPESPNFTAELKPQKKLSLILHHSPLAMVEWDSERVIVGWNSAAAELFSFFEDEAVGQNIDQLLCQRQVANLEPGDWTRCDRAGFLREHTGLSGTKHCRWFNTPFVVRGKQVGTLSTIVEVTHQTALSGEEMRAQLHSRTQVLKHTTARLQAIMRDRAQLQAALQASEERFAQLSTHQTSADIAEQTIESESERHAERQEHTPVFFESLINGITSPLFVKDAEHRLVLANDAFLAFVGRSREEVLGKASSDFMPSEKAKAIRQQDEHVLNSGRTHIAEDYFADSQASNKFVMTTKTRFYGAESAPYLLGSLRDLTEQVIAQKASLESEKRLKKLAANVPGMLYQFKLEPDLTSSFVYVSSNSEALLGLSPSQVKADCDAVLSLIHPDDKASFDRSVALSAQTLSDWRWQGRFLVSEDRIVWLQGASRPERLPDNSVLWDGLFIDISDVKQVEAELQTSEVRLRSQTQQLKATLTKLKQTQVKLIQSEKMSSLGQLVAGIAHEINNPVNFIHGNLNYVRSYTQDMLKLIRLYQAHHPTPHSTIQTLIDDLELDYVVNDLPKLLDSLQQGTRRIREIVLSLRNFSRLDESGLKRTDLHEGLENTLMLLGSRLKETIARPAIEIVKAYECIPLVDCFASQLNQVFMNILTNAIDAIDEAAAPPAEKHQILLQTFQRDDRVVIQISNSGPPIAEETSQRMFDPFFTTKAVGKGTGMGLAISYQTVVGLHKGILEYTQTSDQKPTFVIEIPVTQVIQA